MPLLFVYGSLKEGFPNFHVNEGRRMPGDFHTATPYPFYLIDGQLPCMFAQPGTGLHVTGQLFETDEASLQKMDELERIGQPGGYQRITVEVIASGTAEAAPVTAQAYVQDAALLAQAGRHVGPIATYTAEHATLLRW